MGDIEHSGASASAADDADTGPGTSGQRPQNAGPLREVFRPFTRTGGFYARSWGDYLDRQPDELPVARPTLALATHAFRDEIVLLGMRMLLPVSSDPDAVARVEREVLAALQMYGQAGWLEKPEGFFAAPPPLTDVTVKTVTTRGRTHERISFDSGYEPHPGEPGRERWP